MESASSLVKWLLDVRDVTADCRAVVLDDMKNAVSRPFTMHDVISKRSIYAEPLEKSPGEKLEIPGLGEHAQDSSQGQKDGSRVLLQIQRRRLGIRFGHHPTGKHEQQENDQEKVAEEALHRHPRTGAPLLLQLVTTVFSHVDVLG